MSSKKKAKGKGIPRFRTLEEESAYWDTHSLADHLDECRPVKMRFQGPTKHLMSIRIDLDLVQRIRSIAERKGVPYQTLMQQWLLERAEEEAPALQPGSAYASGHAYGMVREGKP